MNNCILPENERKFVRYSLEAAIQIGLVGILIFWCFDIVKPFITPIIWGGIISVALFPHYLRLQKSLGDRQGLAASLFTLFIMILFIVPAVLLSATLVESVQFIAQGFGDGILTVPLPLRSIGSWPVVGDPLMKFWTLAAVNHEAALQQIAPHLTVFGAWLLLATEIISLDILLFMVAILISGYLLAHAKSWQHYTLVIVKRFSPVRGEQIIKLAENTVRSVAWVFWGLLAFNRFLQDWALLSQVCLLQDYGRSYACSFRCSRLA